MAEVKKERRNLSHAGLLESVIRTVSQLATSGDTNTRMLASRALGDLQRLRREMPTRRAADRKVKPA